MNVERTSRAMRSGGHGSSSEAPARDEYDPPDDGDLDDQRATDGETEIKARIRPDFDASPTEIIDGTGGQFDQPPRGPGARSTRARADRYQRGARRSTAEPLSAAWRPKATAREGGDGRARGLYDRMVRTYGWRVYAIPILLVITALVIVNTATTPAPEQPNAAGPGAGGSGNPSKVEENPAKPVGLNIPTAELPAGGKFTQAGNGRWHVVPGKGDRVGKSGKLYKYTVEVEDGIDPSSYAGDDGFANSVQGILSDPRSWTASDVSLQRVDGNEGQPDFRVSLTTPDTNHRPDICGFTIQYESSCYNASDNRVVINLARWVRGATAFNGDMGIYRQYAINHEVGHALGKSHVGCPANGELAPVMMQQSFGVSNDYVAQLNQVDPSNYGAVPADGKVCKYNAWPSPQGGQAPGG